MRVEKAFVLDGTECFHDRLPAHEHGVKLITELAAQNTVRKVDAKIRRLGKFHAASHFNECQHIVFPEAGVLAAGATSK